MSSVAPLRPATVKFNTDSASAAARALIAFCRFISVSPLVDFRAAASPDEMKNLAGEMSSPDSDPFSDPQFAKNIACLSSQFTATANR